LEDILLRLKLRMLIEKLSIKEREIFGAVCDFPSWMQKLEKLRWSPIIS